MALGLLSVLLSSELAQAQGGEDTSVVSIVTRAYSVIEKNPEEATRLFERAVSIDPSNLLARRQLGYLYLSQEKNEQALEQFTIAESLQSSDAVKLQIAYILLSLDREEDAKMLFTELESSPDSVVRDQASKELAVYSIPSLGAVSRWRTDFYASPYYDTRWEDLFISGRLRHGYYLTDSRKLILYGVLSYSVDTKSKGGRAPVIFSDNTLIFGFGFRARPFTGLLLDIQEGLAFDLIDRGSGRKARGDFRAIATYFNGIYAPFVVHDGVKAPFYPYVDLYTSAGYYSRYKNVIGYLQARGGVRVVEVSRTALDVYALLDMAWDTEKDFYNNVSEGGLGARLTPHFNWGVYLVGEYHRGRYWRTAATQPPYDPYYNSFRLYIIFERSL